MHKPQPASLRHQLLLHLSGPLLLVLVFGGAGGMLIARHVGHLVHDQWLLDSAMSLGAQVKSRDGQLSLVLPPTAIQMFEWDRIDRIYWQASSRRQGLLLQNAAVPPPVAPLALNKPKFYDAIVAGEPVRVVAIERSAPDGVGDTVRIVVAETMHKREGVAGKILRQWAPLQIAVLALAGLFTWRAVTRNLRKVDAIAERLGTYETSNMPVLDTQRMPTEIAPLIDAINRLIVKLSEERDTQKRFISNAAHQLRTPLASLQVQAERALRERDAAERDRALEDVHRAVTRQRHVTHQLLTLMRSEQREDNHLQLGQADLAVIARQAVERWTDSALRKRIDLGYEGPENGVLITGDAQLLEEMMGNLIDNAINYTQPGGMVTLHLSARPPRVTVVDDGPGIPEQERELVLERFYRGSTSDTTQGCGLGLPIASEIAARHDARLAIATGPDGVGTMIGVTFPTAGVTPLPQRGRG
ncbi:sensor histidine kinase [Duganella sp. FT94W]|uniref:histidine kinase n=1 Tax=Duganella lactea TaxID=2692173 RepID=A0ABW9V6N2_9BURK|nr:sensor histidine kinase [Duganella lactea]MYM35248.1 sensor histidine kinase [Duganella lactea]